MTSDSLAFPDYAVIAVFFAAMFSATLALLYWGTRLFPDTPAERADVEAFMDRLENQTKE